MTFRRLLVVFFLFATGLQSAAQMTATVKARTDKTRILIGEPLQLSIEVQVPEKEPIRFVTIDSIAHFEWLEKPVVDTESNSNGTLLRGIYKITSFDSGRWVIPAFELSGGLRTDSIPVEVLFADFDPKADYHDIKDILEAKPETKNTAGWWFVAGGGFLLLLLLLYFFRKKKPAANTEKPVTGISPFDEAMKGLQVLQSGTIDPKTYHTSLAGIFRLYIFRKKGLLSLQETTDDLVLQVKELGLDKSSFDELVQALRLGDFVKFAKYLPGTSDNRQAFESIKKAIEVLEQIN
ncbi:MAG: LPXTG cell wall anchor domain-containing protein [Sphingobacteriales bacterium]|nr:LPXTG cell wall anchor domain-containing protein [Sphingobacteriales bacterium]